jgi:SAM-dependent methyltransferase
MGEDDSRCINGHFSLNTISQFIPSGKLLDVGCSTGFLLNAARLRFEPTGVEPSRWAADYAGRQLKILVRRGTLEEAKFPDASFDVVTLVDVIEHLADPLSTLQEIRRVLKPGGLLYVVTPNIASLMARLMRSRWWGLRPAHIYYFSPRTLRHLLDKAGFEPILLRSYGRVFTLDYWISRLRHYASPIVGFLRWVIRRWGMGRKLVYMNTMDSIECCARKRTA